jgi:RNA polymerase sigma factor (sigma-70 family)
MATVRQASSTVAPWRPLSRGPAIVGQDATSLEAVLATEYARLVRLAGVICREPAEAQDAVQAAVERALRHRGGLRDPAKVTPWLNQIVVREAIRVDQRRRTWLGRLSARPREIEVGSADADPARAGAVAARAVRDALDRLPVDQRVVVALHHYAGYSLAEAAEITGVPLETARSRLRLARARLRRALDELDR